MFHLGIDRLQNDTSLIKALHGRRVALVGHPASVNSQLEHSFDVVAGLPDIHLTAAFGPQHGMRGEKQENMIESDDYRDPKYNIPVFSLYGDVRRPTPEMLETFDLLLFDLQDIGCRIYTYLATLIYLIEDCAKAKKELWVLDRPNPAGRPIEGVYLKKEFFSFVGLIESPIRHGATLGELAQWYAKANNIDIDLKIIEMQGYELHKAPGYGWPELSWVNPSPNIPRLTACRSFCGTVLLEGTTLSEGRGTTLPLEVMGAPDIDSESVLKEMHKIAPQWLAGCKIKPYFFEPVFHKHERRLCNGLQIHMDFNHYDHQAFQPLRMICSYLKAIRRLYPDYDLWINPPYEYEENLMPVDILSGSDEIRLWVDDSEAQVPDLEKRLAEDEKRWKAEFSSSVALYK